MSNGDAARWIREISPATITDVSVAWRTALRHARDRFSAVLEKHRPVRQEVREQAKWPLDRPLISIVIPCFNYGVYVKSAIESALSQTFKRSEIIVINDGSTEKLTLDTLTSLSYEKTRVVHQENKGLAETRNVGAMLAAGKYVCFLDADDHLDPTYVEKTVSILESDESLGSCYSWVQCYGNVDSVWQTSDLSPYSLCRSTTAPSHSVIRKSAWEAVRRFNGHGFISKYNGCFEDWVFWIDLVQCGFRGQVVREPLIYYRVHADSLGSRHRAKFDAMLEILHAERSEFFQSPAYRRKLAARMRQRILISNWDVNMN